MLPVCVEHQRRKVILFRLQYEGSDAKTSPTATKMLLDDFVIVLEVLCIQLVGVVSRLGLGFEPSGSLGFRDWASHGLVC